MKRKGRIPVKLIFFLLAFICPLSLFSQSFPGLAPPNPAFVEFQKKIKEGRYLKGGEGGYGLGYIPSPVDFSHLKATSIIPDGKLKALSYPSLYDLRSQNRLTPVKDQDGYGTCWAFATYGSLESWLKTDEGEEYDFSENHLANLHGFDWGFDEGGNYLMSTAYLTRWSGPVYEEDDPYPDPGGSTGEETVRRHIQQVFFIPPRTGPLDNDNIKYAVMNYGAVGAAMYWSDSSYNSTNKSYYYNGSEWSNHAVAIVGWDDDYPATNFSNTPPGNGAFIVRNSWGTAWGDEGYFYISYYDTVFGCDMEMAVFNNAEYTWNYGSIYQYDPLGMVGYQSPYLLKQELLDNGVDPLIVNAIYEDRVRFANIFTAEGNQNITAVGFYVMNPSVNYTITVRTGVNAGEPESGNERATKSGTISQPGYHTVQLDNPVSVTSGQRFSVVVRFTTTSDSPNVAVEGPVEGYSSSATAEVGESFIGIEHSSFLLPSPYWLDTDTDSIEGYYEYENQDVNVCLKVYTEAASPSPQLSVNPTLLDFGYTETSLTFNIRNTGTGILNWSVSGINYNQGSDWISSISPTSDETMDETDIVTVIVNRNLIGPGTSTATISITSNGGDEDVTVSVSRKSPPERPTNISPSHLATGVSLTPTLQASPFSDPDGDEMLIARWRIEKDGEIIWQSQSTSTSISVPSGVLQYSTTYNWCVQYIDTDGMESEWSDDTSFTTRDRPSTPPARPVNISPANGATGVSLTPLLQASSFSDPDGDTMADSHWRLRSEAGTYEVASVWENSSAGPVTSILVSPPLSEGTSYFWQVRYKDSTGNWSQWSEETSFTTISSSGDEDEGESGGGGGGCFIATAAYGTPMAKEVVKLKKFRDEYLTKSRVGRAFVRWYYRHSPRVAEYIRKRNWARALVRASLRPLLWLITAIGN